MVQVVVVLFILIINQLQIIERTIGGLISIHGRSIARRATMKYDSPKSEDNGQRVSSFNKNKNEQQNIDFKQCISMNGLIPFCISQLAKRVVSNKIK